MSERTYEEYIKNDCHPVGYNEPCQSYYFAQSSVDLLLDKIDQLKQQLEEKDKEIDRLKDFIGCKGCVDVIKKSNKDQTQLAIQELEKVTDYAWFNYEKFRNYLNQQIKELKGEKDDG